MEFRLPNLSLEDGEKFQIHRHSSVIYSSFGKVICIFLLLLNSLREKRFQDH